MALLPWRLTSSSLTDSSPSWKIPRDRSSYTFVDRTLPSVSVFVGAPKSRQLCLPHGNRIWKGGQPGSHPRRFESAHSQTLTYIITTYNTLHGHEHSDKLYRVSSGTHLTAGASAAKGTEPKPAALTAVACNKPNRNLSPTEILARAAFPISSTMKKNQSVPLHTD